jgi:hypothetical protein
MRKSFYAPVLQKYCRRQLFFEAVLPRKHGGQKKLQSVSAKWSTW